MWFQLLLPFKRLLCPLLLKRRKISIDWWMLLLSEQEWRVFFAKRFQSVILAKGQMCCLPQGSPHRHQKNAPWSECGVQHSSGRKCPVEFQFCQGVNMWICLCTPP
ncbi:hypothetical protein NPIL_267681 [Nephila pilipes]|uniref:Uncharacterized protein n=1 Tax=Nephila pilipes TaxID=299642 RepID=A0A8X6MPY8_NEPPI|nr:hypothetical protein NPIL_267681 [Nephila pilipes]